MGEFIDSRIRRDLGLTSRVRECTKVKTLYAVVKRQIVGEVVRGRPSKSPHSKISRSVELIVH